ncbi:flagellar biosynthetic protein FliR [Salinibius halmophilus]|uniref:flagellar biosynthetic protein FliR n=1 Tax=Salinibius halmophilus TaxID=1853216 RepID=UPI000E66BEE1|nr:flagellar biosynthetic protein FliR [Salinibius halmophilus]
MQVTDADIGIWVGQFLWPMFRIAGFLSVAPVLGARTVSARIRIGFAGLLTIVVMPLLDDLPPIPALSLEVFLVVIVQILIGIALGFVLSLLMQVFVVAGQIISMQMGLGFASMMDPANGVSVSLLAQWYQLMITLLFLALGGHLASIEVLVLSFEMLPITGDAALNLDFPLVALLGSWLFTAGLKLALPAVTALLLVNLIFGVMTRSAPQLNIFSLGFPITMVLGIFVAWITIGNIIPHFQLRLTEVLSLMQNVMQGG